MCGQGCQHHRIQRSDIMAGISDFSTSFVQTIYGNSSSSTSSGLFGINVSDYNLIRSGSYLKLMKAYYGNSDIASSLSSMTQTNSITGTTSTAKDDAKTLARVEGAAESLKTAADDLLTKGTNSVFNKVSKTDEEGNTTQEYDTDAIYKKVSAFVDSYNTMLTRGDESNTSGVVRSVSSMIRATASNEKALEKIGITIGEDYQLSIDEETFKKADMNTVKSMFNSTGSYGYQISSQASMANFYAENEAAKANTYTSSGLYTYNYSTGQIYNSYT